MTAARAWAPIATGALAAQLRASCDDVVAAMRARPARGDDPWSALVFAYADRARGDDAHADAIEDRLARACAAVACRPSGPSLYGGATGVAWLLGHLDAADAGATDELDAALARHVARAPYAGVYDLVGGLVGVGVYFLDRPASPRRDGALVAICDRLAERVDADGAWFTPLDELPAWHRDFAPGGYYNLGLAHGIPGAIALLAGIHAAGVAPPRARELAGAAIDWMLALPPTTGPSRFAHWFAPDAPALGAQPSRLAWCYGDLGVAVALLHAARAFGEPRWEAEAIAIARAAAAIGDGPGTPPRDAGLCHGAAGVAHVLGRLAQATDDDVLRAAARRWLERTLAVRTCGGIGGYRAWQGARAEDDDGFLEGAAGTALALLAATTTIEPAWDRVMLLSLPA